MIMKYGEESRHLLRFLDDGAPFKRGIIPQRSGPVLSVDGADASRLRFGFLLVVVARHRDGA